MDKLKIEKKTVYKIDYSDWDRFVNWFFEFNPQGIMRYGYEIAANEEIGNDSRFEYTPDGKISKYDMEYTLGFILNEKKNRIYSTRTIMDYFVQCGILDKGKTYQIVISW